ncbi:MAG: hypothetical protein MJA82_11060 [Clostridia bacterium]|nr:hypothetical protein [Clostridia bacterium]
MIANSDTFAFSIDIDKYDVAIFPLLCLLDEAKENAKREIKNCTGEKVYREIGNMTFEVLSVGTRNYAFILHNDMYEIQLARYRSKNEYVYPVFVRIKSETLWSKGFYGAYQFIEQWIKKNIGVITTTKISRADLCCHTDSIRLNIEDIQRLKTRSREKNVHFSDKALSSMNFGSRSTQRVYCRIYNKSLEIAKKKNKLWFNDIWEKHGLNIHNVWNVEYELNRDFFVEYEIDTVNDFIEKIKNIWTYLTLEWLTLMNLDASRLERCSINEAWRRLCSVFDSFKGSSLVRRIKQMNKDADAMIPQILGCLSSFASKCGKKDFKGAIDTLAFRGYDYLFDVKSTTFDMEIKRKRLLLDNLS